MAPNDKVHGDVVNIVDLQTSVSDILDEGPLGMMSGFITDSQTKVSSTSPLEDKYVGDGSCISIYVLIQSTVKHC